jgi:putative tryptophan/tyrosine transport system substrate-binding protein
MNRRDFIAFVGGVVAWPLSVRAQAQQPSQSRRIAFVFTHLPSDMTEKGDHPGFQALSAELRRLGYSEGHNLVVERYSSWGLKEPFSELAVGVVRQKPDLIFAGSSRIVHALKLATTTIPIVGVMADPVAGGIVESLGRPGGNITGVSVDPGIEISGKQLELLKELLPQPSPVGYLVSRSVWESPYGVAAREAAQRMGISLVGAILDSAQEAEYRRVFAAIEHKGLAGIWVAVQSEHVTHRRLIVELIKESRLPALYPHREHVEVGGLMSYGPSMAELFRDAAGQIDRILKGGKPSDIPIQQSTKVQLVINLTAAKALGLTIAPSLLARADEVIE